MAITSRCNFRCKHCIIPESKADLPYEEIVKLWEEAQGINCFRVHLSGGEPFLRSDLINIAEEARNRGFMVKINSNGSCIKDGIVRKLSEIGVFDYQVSVYGASPETYQAVTGRAEVFHEMQRGIQILLANGARLILKMTVIKENFGDVEKVNDYFLKIQHGYGEDRVRIGFSSLIYPTYEGDAKPLEHMIGIVQQAELARKGYVFQFICPHNNDSRSPLCHAGVDLLYIAVNGDVYPCSFFCLAVGNIFRESLARIWSESNFLDKLLNRVPECMTCKYFTQCIRCPAVAYYLHKDINKAPETICEVVKEIYRETS